MMLFTEMISDNWWSNKELKIKFRTSGWCFWHFGIPFDSVGVKWPSHHMDYFIWYFFRKTSILGQFSHIIFFSWPSTLTWMLCKTWISLNLTSLFEILQKNMWQFIEFNFNQGVPKTSSNSGPFKSCEYFRRMSNQQYFSNEYY